MEKLTDGKIFFENIIITPLERWVNTDFDLDEDTVQALNQLAEESNQSVDNVVNHILADFFAEHLELSKLNAETLLKTGEKSPPKKRSEKDLSEPGLSKKKGQP